MLRAHLTLLAALASGTAASAQWLPPGNTLVAADDALVFPVNLGFAFPLPGGGGATTTQIAVSTDGFVKLTGAPASTSSQFSENVTLFLAEEPRIAAHWDNLDDAGNVYSGGRVSFRTDATIAVVTWTMFEFSSISTRPVDAQIQLYPDGRIVLCHTTNVGTDAIVGVSAGNGALNPGATDLSSLTSSAPLGWTVYEQFTASTPCDLGDTCLEFRRRADGYDVIARPIGLPTASKTISGTGCPVGAATQPENRIHEVFASPASDPWDIQNGTSIRYIWSGLGYTASNVPFVWDASFANPLTNADMAQGNLDDGLTSPLPLGFTAPIWGGASTEVVIGTNGIVWLDGQTSGSPLALGTSLPLGDGPVLTLASFDLDANVGAGGSGAIHFDTGAGYALVTWDQVTRFGNPLESFTAQAKLFPSGDILVSYLANNVAQAAHAGLFEGSPLPATAEIDFTTSLPFTAVAPGTNAVPLALDSDLPRLGSSPLVSCSGVRNTALATVLHVGFVPLGGIDLTFLGMPGCFGYVAPDFDVFFLSAQGFGSARATVTLTVPNVSSLAGAVVRHQALSLDPGINALGLSASNQLAWTLGV